VVEVVENMVKRAKPTTPKLWIRRSGRLWRRNSVDDPPEGHTRSSILDLPEECLVIVLKNLTAYEIANVARVCKRFYQVSYNPTLWSCIDLSFEEFLSWFLPKVSFVDMDNYDWKEVITNARRRMSFASFLVARKAALAEIRARGDLNIFREGDMLIYLLNNCNVKNLKKIELWLPGGYWDWEFTRCFQRVLRCLVRNCWNVLKSLRCEVDVSYTTAKLLGSLHNLEYLNLHFPLQDVLQPEALDVILSSLPNLKYFKITIRQQIYDEDFPGYVFKSDSLETLDFGHTKQFWIQEMTLPKLHTINAESLHTGYYIERDLCLFDVVERGCPLIQTLNGYTSLLPGLHNFHLSETQKRQLCFCECSVHSLSRGYF